MFKRLFWLVLGAGFGFGMSFWITRMARDRLARFTPGNVSGELARAARDLGKDLRAAVAEGAAAMREREAELREQVETNPAR